MKILLTALLAVTVCRAYGQESRETIPASARFGPEHEIRLSVGAFPLFTDGMDGWNYDWNMPADFQSTKYYQGPTHTTGVLSGSYSYRYKRWNFGLTVCYTHEYYRTYSNLDNTLLARRSADFISVVPTVRYTWLNNRSIRLYSAFGLGATFFSGDSNAFTPDSAVALHITYVGIAVGGRFFGFAELGTGAQGTLSAGVGYRFNGKKAKR